METKLTEEQKELVERLLSLERNLSTYKIGTDIDEDFLLKEIISRRYDTMKQLGLNDE